MCDSMGDFFLFSHYDVGNFDNEGLDNYYRQRYRKSNRSYIRANDPTYYSRVAAVCEKCGARYGNLQRSVTETAKNARKDGWQIERTAKGYEWYCTKCKALHDFENIASIPTSCGKWISSPCGSWYCSICGAESNEMSPFCSQCGAKMDENERE